MSTVCEADSTLVLRKTPVVVVGVDGSPASSAALRFAANEARLRGASLTVVKAWNPPAAAEDPRAHERHRQEAYDAASQALDAQLREVLSSHADLSVSTHVRADAAVRAIIEAAAEAALVVVGTRERRGISGRHFGSVSRALARRARCPVTIVRSDATGIPREA